MIEAPHIGNMLKAFVKEKRIFQSGWARQMGVKQQTVANYLKSPNMQVATLFKISQALNYNFIADVAAQLHPLPNANTAMPNEELEALKKENEKLKMEVEILRSVVGLMNK
jgi:transcriptional regulator with XRE-family HTH domain